MSDLDGLLLGSVELTLEILRKTSDESFAASTERIDSTERNSVSEMLLLHERTHARGREIKSGSGTLDQLRHITSLSGKAVDNFAQVTEHSIGRGLDIRSLDGLTPVVGRNLRGFVKRLQELSDELVVKLLDNTSSETKIALLGLDPRLQRLLDGSVGEDNISGLATATTLANTSRTRGGGSLRFGRALLRLRFTDSLGHGKQLPYKRHSI